MLPGAPELPEPRPGLLEVSGSSSSHSLGAGKGLGFWVLRGLGFSGLGFRGLGFRALGFKGLGGLGFWYLGV